MRIVYTMTISPLAGAPVERRVLRSRTDQTVRQPRIQIGDGVKDQTPSELSETGTTAVATKLRQRRRPHAQIRRGLRGTHILVTINHENLRITSKRRYRSAPRDRKSPVGIWNNSWATTIFFALPAECAPTSTNSARRQGAASALAAAYGSGQEREGQPRASARARFARAGYFETGRQLYVGATRDHARGLARRSTSFYPL
jgi:hypothetical protein